MTSLPPDEMKLLDVAAQQLVGTSDNCAIWIAIIPTWKLSAQILQLRDHLVFFRQCLKQFEIPNPGLLSMSAFYHPNNPASLRRVFESIAVALPQPATRTDRHKWLYETCLGATHLRGTIRVIEACAPYAIGLAESQNPPIDSMPIASLASLGTMPTTIGDVDSAIKLSDRLLAISRIKEQEANEKSHQKSHQQGEQKPPYDPKVIGSVFGSFGWLFWLGWAIPDFIKNYEEPWFKHFYVPLAIICFGVSCYLILKNGFKRRRAISALVSIVLTLASGILVIFGYARRIPPSLASVRIHQFTMLAVICAFVITLWYGRARWRAARNSVIRNPVVTEKPAILQRVTAPNVMYIMPYESSAVLPPLAPGPWMESSPPTENSQG
jgi:hypothetical protein